MDPMGTNWQYGTFGSYVVSWFHHPMIGPGSRKPFGLAFLQGKWMKDFDAVNVRQLQPSANGYPPEV